MSKPIVPDRVYKEALVYRLLASGQRKTLAGEALRKYAEGKAWTKGLSGSELALKIITNSAENGVGRVCDG